MTEEKPKQTASQMMTSEAALDGELPKPAEESEDLTKNESTLKPNSSPEGKAELDGKSAPKAKAGLKGKSAPKAKAKLKAKAKGKASSKSKGGVSTERMGVERVISKILSKQYGRRLLFAPREEEIGIPTGSIELDAIIGPTDARRLGWPMGRISEVHGWESVGKTTLVTHAMIETQKLGMVPGLIDFEHAFDEKYAAAQGLDMSDGAWFYTRPPSMEEAQWAMTQLLDNNVCDFIAIDSAAAMLPKQLHDDSGLDREGGKGRQIGLQSNILSELLSQWSKKIAVHNVALLFTNQMRAKPGDTMNPVQAAAGNALKFYASVRVELKLVTKTQKLIMNPLTHEEEKREVDIIVRAYNVKNKVHKPMGRGEIRIVYGEGIDNVYSLVRIGKAREVIQTNGSWFTYEGTSEAISFRVQGNDALDQTFRESASLQADLRSRLNL